MKVQFDAQSLFENDKTGIALTIQNIIFNMAKKHRDKSYYLNYFSLLKKSTDNILIHDLLDIGCRRNECRWFHPLAYKMLYNFIPVPYSLFFGDDADITHFMNFYIPPGVKGKVITMVYDMVYKAYPETMNRKTRFMLNMSMERSTRRADAIITISEFSKAEIIKYLGVPPERIYVMPCGVDFKKFRPDYDLDDIAKTKSKYGITKDYFLYLGTLEPRKNIERLIEAYGLLKKRIGCIPKLVISGKKGWLYDTIFERVNVLDLGNDVIFTGYVDENDVPVLMKGAFAFVFPSLYEGFGLPPLEAMACGTPVIASNAASLPEVVGDAGLLIDPYSVESISKALECLLMDPSLQSELADKGLKRAVMFTWEKSVDIISEVYEQISKQNSK